MTNLKSNKSGKKSGAQDESNKRKLAKKEKMVVSEDTPATELAAPSYKVTWVSPAEIKVDIASRCRPVIPKLVETLVAEIPKDGLRTPLTITWLDGVAHLVVGLQRLEALKILDWDAVPCVCENDKIAAQRWQIGENLHRGELTKLQRANQTAALLELETNSEGISGEKAQKKKRGRPEAGDAKAARTINVRGKTVDAKRKNIGFDRKVSGIHADAQRAMVQAGLDDDGDALGKVAKQPTREAQLAKVKALAKSSNKAGRGPTEDEPDDAKPPLVILKREWKKAKKLRAAWENASLADRRAFIIEDLGYPLDEESEVDDDEGDDETDD
jgi:ParB-like chromosome segregation protein Spo0J